MRYVISLGSNTSDKRLKMALAMENLRHCDAISVESSSDFYETPAMGGGSRKYLNAVACLESDFDYDTLNMIFKQLEKQMGRDEAARRRGDVPIDIDIVIAGGEVKRPKDHTAMHFRIGEAMIARETAIAGAARIARRK